MHAKRKNVNTEPYLLGTDCYTELLYQIVEEKQAFPMCTRDLKVTVNIRMNITIDYVGFKT